MYYKIKRMFIIIADQYKSGRVSTLNQLKCIQCILIEVYSIPLEFHKKLTKIEASS